MTSLTSLRRRVRIELGDRSQGFRDTFRGSGDVAEYQLSRINISPSSFKITSIGRTTTDLVAGTDFELDSPEGYITFPAPVPDGVVLLVEGESFGMMSDEELDEFLHDAVLQHIAGRTVSQRYRTSTGFISYHEVPITLENLPEVEDYLVVLLCTIQVLWALSTDAATDIDISAPDGTNVPRGQRYAQLLKQIDVLTDKYMDLCGQYNVGLFRIEMSDLRRVSRTTGRYVPLFVAREYDDNRMPDRKLPEIDKSDVDVSGIPSPAWMSWGYGSGGAGSN